MSFKWDVEKNCMQIKGQITHLTPGYHGFHIHELGDLQNGCISTGGHYNPAKVDHAGPTNSTQHIGDLGNILAYQDGIAFVDICVDFVHTIGEQSVIGRAVVVHAGPDDLGSVGDVGSKKTGNAGGRVGCGVIGVAR